MDSRLRIEKAQLTESSMALDKVSKCTSSREQMILIAVAAVMALARDVYEQRQHEVRAAFLK